MRLVGIAGYFLNFSFNETDRITRKFPKCVKIGEESGGEVGEKNG